MEFKGIYSVLLTAFKDEDKSFDEDRMRSHIDRVIEKGVDGIIPSGSTGEFASLTEDERKKVIEVTIDQVNGRVPVVVGTAAPSTKETIKWTKFAEDAGADGAMVVPPYYGKQTDEALYQHYARVANATEMDVMIYNNVGASGNDVKPKLACRLGEIDNINYVKTTVSARRMQDIIQLCPDKMKVFTGVDDLLFECFMLGGVGAVSGASNSFPTATKKLYDLIWEEKDFEGARKLWYKFLPIARLCEIPAVWIQYNRRFCELVGDPMGPPREPLLPIPEEENQKLRKLIENLKAVI